VSQPRRELELVATNQGGRAPRKRPRPVTEGIASMQDQPTCRDCGTQISSRSKSGRCRRCCMAATGRANRTYEPKPCPECGEPVTRPDNRWCSRECYDAGFGEWCGADSHAWKGEEAGRWAQYSRSRRTFEATACNRCGATDELVRHHIDDCKYGHPRTEANTRVRGSARFCRDCERERSRRRRSA
jgi:endogenous inhibitor of DNA gyrase (YacG/DUF329 family)